MTEQSQTFWDRVLHFAAAGLLMSITFGIIFWMLWTLGDPLPPCTDLIAETGGVCSGPIR